MHEGNTKKLNVFNISPSLVRVIPTKSERYNYFEREDPAQSESGSWVNVSQEAENKTEINFR